MFESILCQAADYDPEVLEALIGLAVEIAREGREGRRIGTLFALGDEEAVLMRSRALILNPLEATPRPCATSPIRICAGPSRNSPSWTEPSSSSSSGVVLAACRYLDAAASPIELPLGLGSRHIAAAHISSATGAVGIMVSESLVVRLFCHGSIIGEIIPELWMLKRYDLGGKAMVKETQGHLAVIRPGRARSPH